MASGFMGAYRLEWPGNAPSPAPDGPKPGARAQEIQTASESTITAQAAQGAQKLVPGEAIAGYIGAKGLIVHTAATGAAAVAGPTAEAAANSAAASELLYTHVLAWVFLAVTIFLRVFGTMDPKAPSPASTIQWHVVLFSVVAFIALIYANGNQFWGHTAIPNQELFGALVAIVLGIIVPVFYGFLAARTGKAQVLGT